MPAIPAEKVIYWTKDEPVRNFGDYLTELFLQRLFTCPRVDGARYRLVGSVIDDWIIDDDLKEEADPAARILFWGCGKRDDRPLLSESLNRAAFFGVRGPLTRAMLDLPDATPLGDPGLLIPLLHKLRPADTAGQTVCVPHILDPGEDLLARSGADRLLQPTVASIAELELLIDRIAAAEFVLAGSLHAAIVACAYRRPFGFWDSGHIDVPFKWHDFAASIGIEARFTADIHEAKAIYETDIAPRLRKPRLSPLLRCAPLKVRWGVRLKAWFSDITRLGS